jgi:hypothetical protein
VSTVADTIYQQLGGNRFRLMTGAEQLIGYDDGLRVKLPRGSGCSFVLITLDWATDTYTVAALNYKRGASQYDRVREVSLVHAGELRAVFTDLTGLACSLGQVRRTS